MLTSFLLPPAVNIFILSFFIANVMRSMRFLFGRVRIFLHACVCSETQRTCWKKHGHAMPVAGDQRFAGNRSARPDTATLPILQPMTVRRHGGRQQYETCGMHDEGRAVLRGEKRPRISTQRTNLGDESCQQLLQSATACAVS